MGCSTKARDVVYNRARALNPGRNRFMSCWAIGWNSKGLRLNLVVNTYIWEIRTFMINNHNLICIGSVFVFHIWFYSVTLLPQSRIKKWPTPPFVTHHPKLSKGNILTPMHWDNYWGRCMALLMGEITFALSYGSINTKYTYQNTSVLNRLSLRIKSTVVAFIGPDNNIKTGFRVDDTTCLDGILILIDQRSFAMHTYCI